MKGGKINLHVEQQSFQQKTSDAVREVFSRLEKEYNFQQ
jgi:hypothetical protein